MREMRRKERQISCEEAEQVLSECEYAVLATVNTADNTPYCVPVSPVYLNHFIYFHCAPEGQKLDNIRDCSSVCLTAVGKTKLDPAHFTTLYECAVAKGTAELVADSEEKVRALRALCEKYASSNMIAFENAVEKSLSRTAVVRIRLEELTGKAKRQKE